MIRFVLALVALVAVALPTLAGAEEIWRWRDASGVLNYSNQPSHVPSDAVPVRTRLDVISATRAPVPASASRKTDGRATAPAAGRREVYRPGWMQDVGACGSAYPYFCPPWSLPYLLALNGSDLADQVKEANLLDALHVSWRTCR